MDLSVVVVTYNSSACVSACLSSIRERLPAAELIAVDNASADETVEIVRAAGAKLIQNERNEGFGRAVNRAAAEAGRSHLLVLNPDVQVVDADPTELERLFRAETVGLVGPEARPGSGLLGPQLEPSLMHEWLEQTLGALRPRELRPAERRSPPNGRVDWLSGSMLLARRSEFLAVEGFDRRFFLYYEDRDLAARYRQRRLPLSATAAFAGKHMQGASSTGDHLRVVPAGWAFLGWVEYLFLHRGETTARRAATSALTALRSVTLGVASGQRLLRAGRLTRKRRQLEALLAFLAERAAEPADADSFCPEARRLVAEALR